MKTINVVVMIQMDIEGVDEINEVKTQLELIDSILNENSLNSQPQIFIDGICEDDILEPLNEE